MLHCDHCKVDLPGTPRRCPLCQNMLTGQPDETGDVFPRLPAARAAAIRTLLAWSAFGSVSVAAICVTINLALNSGGWWSLFVAAGIVSLWVDFAIVIKKRKNLHKNILWQVATVSLLAFLWDLLTSFHGWSLDYVLPILCTSGMIAMMVLAKIRRLHIQDYILYLGMDCILGIGAFVLIIVGAVRVVMPSAICFGASVIFLAFLFSFEGEALWAELQRRLHM